MSDPHLTGKIVSHVLKAAYPTSQPGSFSSEIADLLARLDTVSSASDAHGLPRHPGSAAGIIAHGRKDRLR